MIVEVETGVDPHLPDVATVASMAVRADQAYNDIQAYNNIKESQPEWRVIDAVGYENFHDLLADAVEGKIRDTDGTAVVP